MSGGFFSSFSSLFGGAASNGAQSRQVKNPSIFGSGYPSGSRRAPLSRLDDAWTLPYNYPNGPASPPLGASHSGTPGNAYPPPSSSAYPLNPAASDSLANLASASSHTLVPPGRASLMEARSATGVSIPSTSFPPLRHTWARIRDWSENNYFELKDTLNWPATEAQIDDLEFAIGFSLPPAVRDSYLCHNGQELESSQSCNDGIFFGLPLLSLDQVAEEWKFWRAVDDDPTSGASGEVRMWQSSCPDKWVRPEYSCRGWIPLITDRVGNYIGVDMTPHPSGGGAPGQVIVFGRDFDTKVVLWRGEGEGGWGRFLQYVAEELESGELWTLEDTSSGSEDEEDAIGYESYFSGGGSGGSRGGGDRGGEGAAGFRLTGEYKGWPVLEAWADRSMRCWEEVGLPSGMPAGQLETPSVRLSSVEEADGVEQGEGSGSTGQNGSARSSVEVNGPMHPLQEASTGVEGSSSASSEHVNGLGVSSPSLNAAPNGRPFSPAMDSPAAGNAAKSPPQRRISDTLSPPAPSTKASRNKQKQRELAASPSASPSPSPSRLTKRQPPAPVQPLDLPTIDDVRAVQAAALAEHERSAQVQYSDLDGTTSGLGTLSLGRNGTIRAGTGSGAGLMGNTLKRGSSSQRNSLNMRSDTLELESRTSADALRTNSGGGAPGGRDILRAGSSHREGSGDGALSDVVIVGEPRRSLQSPTIRSPRTSGDSRRNYFDPGHSSGNNLMDSSVPNSPNLRGAGNLVSPSASQRGSTDYVASPLSAHAFPAMNPTRSDSYGSMPGSGAASPSAAASPYSGMAGLGLSGSDGFSTPTKEPPRVAVTASDSPLHSRTNSIKGVPSLATNTAGA